MQIPFVKPACQLRVNNETTALGKYSSKKPFVRAAKLNVSITNYGKLWQMQTTDNEVGMKLWGGILRQTFAGHRLN